MRMLLKHLKEIIKENVIEYKERKWSEESKELIRKLVISGDFKKFSVRIQSKDITLDAPRNPKFTNQALVDIEKGTVVLGGVNPLAEPTAINIIEALNEFNEFQNLKVYDRDKNFLGTISDLFSKIRQMEHESEEYGEEGYKKYKYKVIKTLDDFPWFHATRKNVINNIRKKGLMPSIQVAEELGQQSGWAQLNLNLQDAVYLTSNKEYAERIAETLSYRYEEDAIILKINMTFNPKKVILDEDAIRSSYDGMLDYSSLYRDIPSFVTSLVHDIQSIGYKGVIPPRNIKIISKFTAPKYDEEGDLVGGAEWFEKEG